MAEGQTSSPIVGARHGWLARSWVRDLLLRELTPTVTRRRSLWVAATMLLVSAGVLASVLGARAVARSDADKQRLSFHLASAGIASTLRLALQHEEDLVVSASAYVTANPSASPADFDKWVRSVRAMQRYPELQNIGLVALVPASGLRAFQARIAAEPLRPLGPHSLAPDVPFQIMPAGRRSHYCLAIAGLARNPASYIPQGLDYCALAPALMPARASGLASYAPFESGHNVKLGVETPVYRGGLVPQSAAARRQAFLGWLGELLLPDVVLHRALAGHPNIAVSFRYNSGSSHVAFASGSAPVRGQSTTIDLHNGWTVRSTTAMAADGVMGDWHAQALLVGGALLSLLFGALVLVVGTGRRRALALVREKTRELSHQALHDALTGLPNRALVLDRAEQMLARVARQHEMAAGALFIDVDGFKRVNDNLGHAAGDRLLKVTGKRLQSVVRDQDTVGRLGGDEFVVLVETRRDRVTLDVLAERLTEDLREPVELDDGQVVSITASVGVAVGRYATPDELLRDADLALYAAKAAGRNRYALFDASMSPSRPAAASG
jgi:diguanylate cyclase (GGDEF)-like protein